MHEDAFEPLNHVNAVTASGDDGDLLRLARKIESLSPEIGEPHLLYVSHDKANIVLTEGVDESDALFEKSEREVVGYPLQRVEKIEWVGSDGEARLVADRFEGRWIFMYEGGNVASESHLLRDMLEVCPPDEIEVDYVNNQEAVDLALEELGYPAQTFRTRSTENEIARANRGRDQARAAWQEITKGTTEEPET